MDESECGIQGVGEGGTVEDKETRPLNSQKPLCGHVSWQIHTNLNSPINAALHALHVCVCIQYMCVCVQRAGKGNLFSIKGHFNFYNFLWGSYLITEHIYITQTLLKQRLELLFFGEATDVRWYRWWHIIFYSFCFSFYPEESASKHCTYCYLLMQFQIFLNTWNQLCTALQIWGGK